MKRAITLATGFAAGYVAGTKAGREKYEQMRFRVHEVSQRPAVVGARANVQERVESASKTVAGKAMEAASVLTKKLQGSSHDHDEDPATPVVAAPALPGEYPAAPTGIVPGAGAV